MRHAALGIVFAAAIGSLPAVTSAQESFPLVVNYAVHHDAAPPHGSDILGPSDIESPHERELPLRYPHPEHVDRPVLDAPAASTTSLPLSGTPGQWDGVSVGEAGGGYWIPPDPTGAVGTTEYVQWVNGAFAIFNKTDMSRKTDPSNSSISAWKGNAIWKGFGGGCETNNDGDPIVQFDKLANRWVMTQFSVSTKPYLQCIAVSSTDSFYDSFFGQNGATFYRYAFSYSYFNDYPKLGVWPDAYYVTFNMFRGTFVGPWACAYDRAKMLQGQPATQVCFKISSTYSSLMPADVDGAAHAPSTGLPNYLLSLGSGNCATVGGVPKGCLNFWKFHVDFTTPANSTLTRTTLYVNAFNRACNGGACIPQLGTSQRLDSLGDRLMWRLAYRNFGTHEALVANHSVNASSATGLRWYELQNAAGGTLASATPVVYQQGTFAPPDGLYRWMGSIAMDHVGNIAVGYSVSSSAQFPGIAVTGRASTDPLGTLAGLETSIIAGSGYQTKSRWGDYTHLAVDPTDDCTFYYTNQYLPNNGAWNWKTRISQFKFDSCQ